MENIKEDKFENVCEECGSKRHKTKEHERRKGHKAKDEALERAKRK